MPTKNDVITKALRILRVLSREEAPVADDAEYAGDVLDSILAEVGQDAPLPFNVEDTPSASFFPLANYLAAQIAPHFTVAAPDSPEKAKLRFVATIRPDDRLEVPEAEYY